MTATNAAAMREALMHAHQFLHQGRGATSEKWLALVKEINAALAAPARNCDKYTHDEALKVWAAESENPQNGCFDEWLYLAAQEGGGDGSK